MFFGNDVSGVDLKSSYGHKRVRRFQRFLRVTYYFIFSKCYAQGFHLDFTIYLNRFGQKEKSLAITFLVIIFGLT